MTTTTAPHALTLNAASITRRLGRAGISVVSSRTRSGAVRSIVIADDTATPALVREARNLLIQAGYEAATTAVGTTVDAVLVTLPEPVEAGEPVEVEAPAAVVVDERGGELRQTEHGARYLTADEVAAERDAATDEPGVTLRGVGAGLYEVVVDEVASGRVMRTTPPHVTLSPRWASYTTTGLRVASGLTSRREAVAALLAEVEAEGVFGPRRFASPAERLAARYGLPVVDVVTATDEVLDEVLDRTPDTDALDERPRPLDAGEVATAVATWGGRLGDGPAALGLLRG